MTRLAVSLLLTIVFFAGCTGPIETRVQTISSAESPQLSSFHFSDVTAPNAQISDLVKRELDQALEAKGYLQSKQAPILLGFSIADRPASIAIQLGEDNNVRKVTSTKEDKPFQSCKDREHRLIVTLIQKGSGEQLYRGTASEYHCKAKMQQTVPHLVKAALSDLGGNSSGTVRQRVLTRPGLD